jgi:DNA-binding NarL/FixJ family response regulator
LGILERSSPMAIPAPNASSPTVLIVDDGVPFVHAAAELLTDRGFEVLGHAVTAQDAIHACRRLRPDAVLLDVRLPDGNGIAVAETLCAEPRPPRILLTSSDPTAVSPDQLRRSGASGFVPKSELARDDLSALLDDAY